jgi:hypothetical protein
LGLLAAGAGSGTGLALCFRIRPLPKSRLALNVSAMPVFSGATRSVPQFSLEFYLLVGSLALTAGALFVLFFAT